MRPTNEVQIATGKINNETIRLRKLRDFRLDRESDAWQ
jgi:hypothetical protein